MGLLTDGYFPDTYWPMDYFIDDYWPDYGAVIKGVYGTTFDTPDTTSRTYDKPSTQSRTYDKPATQSRTYDN